MLTSRLERYEAQEAGSTAKMNQAAKNPGPSTSSGSGSYPSSGTSSNNYLGRSYDPKKDRSNVAYHKTRNQENGKKSGRKRQCSQPLAGANKNILILQGLK